MRTTVLRPVLTIQQGAVERNARFDDPDRLRAERDSLAAFLIGQATLATENRELRELLGMRERLPPGFIPAEIVRIPGRGVQGYFQLTRGAEAGVRVGAPIVTPGGLVGRISRVDGNAAFGIDWMNPEFRASAMTADGTVWGIAEPRRGPGGEPMLALTGTPRHVELEDGTLIVTSGHGGVFPRGIPIGSIAGAEGAETSWQRTYLIEPAVSPAEMTYVLVLAGQQDDAELEDLASGWGVEVEERPVADTTASGLRLPTDFPGVGPAGAAPAGGAGAQPGGAAEGGEAGEGPAEAAPQPTGPPLLGEPVRPGNEE